jgi:hypothetical protein
MPRVEELAESLAQSATMVGLAGVVVVRLPAVDLLAKLCTKCGEHYGQRLMARKPRHQEDLLLFGQATAAHSSSDCPTQSPYLITAIRSLTNANGLRGSLSPVARRFRHHRIVMVTPAPTWDLWGISYN